MKLPIYPLKHFQASRILPIAEYRKTAIYLTLAMYFVGFAGLNLPLTSSLFKILVPFHLLSNAIILFLFHEDKNKNFAVFCVIIFLAGYVVELAGVSTGLIFGNYWYGKTLGLKIWETPLIIGANWLALVYMAGVVCNKLKIHFIAKSLTGAFLMTLLDLFIEPMAIYHDFWHWHNEIIPLQNYAAWFVVSFLFLVLFYKFNFRKYNSIALWMFGMQFSFFLLHQIILHSF